jgi:uncharacterized protein DUF4431
MRLIRSTFLLISLTAVSGAYLPVRAQCLKYLLDVVTLTGTISSNVFAGPPNYESIKHGDRKETAIILTLNAPICTNGGGDPEIDEPESKIRDLQLVITKPADWKTVRRRLGKRVTVTGILFHALTGHHRTKVLIDVTNIEAAESQLPR